ncbi:MAG TPA: PP2C family protein-serine/threonine phosphatase [Leptospiraceae bacterium]|nr:PP2C family protein-serine/threonine phosphatase [Leptospiraceae bacterium]HMW04604.1 PP2C family protein-serine/threonine phosphatase [Leptospiraceae bacterium]HMX34196.1 PP2C family protein-serine/threonine phosphatase [Leptospiraceae bacterium]HMY30441.1 PP2C family protein-serine/threonine phosphatase [Leptospiraceae bacterium]HMZ66408.1 PP2C family protein-serine/threonine phosphatase [Leptospiraceae bacterium]
MANPFNSFNQHKYSIILKNAVLFILFAIAAYILDPLEFVQISHGLFWIVYNTIYIILFLFVNFPELKYLKRLLDLLNYFHTSESHSLDFVNLNLQTFVFPLNLSDENYEVFGKLQPATYLGGDIINHARDNDGNYWFAVGDASGHDLNSHLFSMMILNQMNYLVNVAKTPKDMNAMMNKVLRERIESYPVPVNSYASLGLLKADAKGNFEHYGLHPNFLLYRVDKKDIEVIETSGHFIGIEVPSHIPTNPKEEYNNRNFTMNSGDILFCFTDGLFEQRNKERKYFGYRLYEFIKNEDKSNFPQFAKKLFDSVRTFAGVKQLDDDMTILIIRKK